MSTILKALRRLEADATPDTTEGAAQHGQRRTSLPATDPRAADELRDRILAEEAAAEINPDAGRAARRSRVFLGVGLAGSLLLAVGLGAFMIASSDKRESSGASEASAAAEPLRTPVARQVVAPVAAPAPPVPARIPPPARPVPAAAALAAAAASTESTEPEMPLAAVVPTPARAEADAPRADLTKAPTAPKHPKPNQIERPTRAAAQQTPDKVSAATVPPESKPAARLASKPAATPASKAESNSVAKPIAPPKASAEAQSVESVDDRGLPGVAVLRTAWHPTPERRSAKVRVEATGQVVSLREGDAVGGLVVQEISPSSVVFKAGDVEIRRRVGQP